MNIQTTISTCVIGVSLALGYLNLSPRNEDTSSIGPAEAMRMLEEGHNRWVSGKPETPRTTVERVKETGSNGQKPFATILSCADSRVPVETIFDQGIGDLFVIRVAGNVADTDEIGTAEYGCGHLGTRLLVVLGHTKCGAVTAVVENAQVGGSIPALVDNITPAVKTAKAKNPGVNGKALVQCAIECNVFQSIHDLISNSSEIKHLVAQGKLKIIGAVYDIETANIQWLGEHPNQAGLIGTKH
ncbi:MAG: carbonic anhydrase [Fimbriimonadaceae bacterium]|nr:carbonic anhydrase [Fimbriimonadaceae bacterium]QYK58262.1 MAG: carbonic anhydrase [Fimbriimonadaceae bacterium]